MGQGRSHELGGNLERIGLVHHHRTVNHPDRPVRLEDKRSHQSLGTITRPACGSPPFSRPGTISRPVFGAPGTISRPAFGLPALLSYPGAPAQFSWNGRRNPGSHIREEGPGFINSRPGIISRPAFGFPGIITRPAFGAPGTISRPACGAPPYLTHAGVKGAVHHPLPGAGLEEWFE
jgi:hypothetical protein